MKAYLFIFFSLIVSINSQNCTEVQNPGSAQDCYFKAVFNENNTCCYIVTENGAGCYEVNFELFDNETKKNSTIDEAAGSKAISFSCDSDQRSEVTQASQNYLYVGVLTLLSLLF